MNTPIYVTQPSLPPLEDFVQYLEQIWQSKILTNNGPLHQRLERELSEYLGVPYVSLFNNGTIALLVAIQSLQLKGEVITTPFTFIATSNAILWNNLTPVFVDIKEDDLNLNPELIEDALTERTSAILPVHCYGNPCDVEGIQSVADKHGLRVVYDAAHAFGVSCHCGSILNHGDLSVLSFHATKVFNTFEGGAIVCNDPSMKLRIDRLKNFGFESERAILEPSLNGKMSEVQAAMGLAQLAYVSRNIERRREVDRRYRELLKDLRGIRVVTKGSGSRNFSYFPIVVTRDCSVSRDFIFDELARSGFYSRKYFFPLVSELLSKSMAPAKESGPLPIAKEFAGRVLCLPMYSEIDMSSVDSICDIVRQSVAN